MGVLARGQPVALVPPDAVGRAVHAQVLVRALRAGVTDIVLEQTAWADLRGVLPWGGDGGVLVRSECGWQRVWLQSSGLVGDGRIDGVIIEPGWLGPGECCAVLPGMGVALCRGVRLGLRRAEVLALVGVPSAQFGSYLYYEYDAGATVGSLTLEMARGRVQRIWASRNSSV